MRTTLALVLLAACSGGGGGFTPSGNLDVTHAFLRANWNGTAREDDNGNQSGAGIAIYTPGGVSRTDYLDCSVAALGYTALGTVQAGGDRVIGSGLISGTSFHPNGGSTSFDLVLQDNQTRLVGTYRLTFNATATAVEETHTGTLNLLRASSLPAVIERQTVIDVPGAVVIVREIAEVGK